MKARMFLVVVATACATVVGGGEASAQRGAPMVERMVVFPGGRVETDRVRTERTTVTVGKRACAVAAATPMAALLHSLSARIRLVDYGSCSARPVDGSNLFVKALGGFVNRGLDGWVYKVGRRLGTAGGADPAGPFGNGRLRRGSRVVWFYCKFAEQSCQRSLELDADVAGGEVHATVTGYDDEGDGAVVSGAKVVVQTPRGREVASETTDADGRVTVTLGPGRYTVHARKRGAVRSFEEKLRVL